MLSTVSFKGKSTEEITFLFSGLQEELLEKDLALSEKEIALSEKEIALSEKEIALSEKDHALLENEKVIADKNQTISTLHNQLQAALRARFSPKSEKLELDAFQESFFDEAELPENVDIIEAEEESITVALAQRKKSGRKPLPKDLPRTRQVYDLSAEEKVCPCGCELTHIGEEASEQLDFIPAKIHVIQHIRLKYACKQCEDTIKTAARPELPIPKSIASPGLLSHVLVSKYCDHLPLYRQENILRRHDIDIPRNTLCNWVIKSGELLNPLVDLLKKTINEYDIAYSDETVLQVLKEEGRPATSKSYMWVFSGGPPDKQSYFYQYSPTRGSSVPLQFFKTYSGYLHTDCYGGYNPLTALRPEEIKLTACWAHARRYFVDIVKSHKNKKPGSAHVAVSHIAKLYRIEKEAREEGLAAEAIKQRRNELSKPLLEEFKSWLDKQANRALPKSPIGKAIAYCLNHWDKLLRYVEDGRLEIDNNRSERAIKPFVIGRKNWLFSDSVKGAESGTVIYSLIETCRAHDIEPYAYLKYVLGEIVHCETDEARLKLLPFNCDKTLFSKEWVPRQRS